MRVEPHVVRSSGVGALEIAERRVRCYSHEKRGLHFFVRPIHLLLLYAYPPSFLLADSSFTCVSTCIRAITLLLY